MGWGPTDSLFAHSFLHALRATNHRRAAISCTDTQTHTGMYHKVHCSRSSSNVTHETSRPGFLLEVWPTEASSSDNTPEKASLSSGTFKHSSFYSLSSSLLPEHTRRPCISSSSNQGAQKPTKAVRFHSSAICHVIPQKTNEEQRVAWYSPEERTAFQQETKKTLRHWVRCKSEKELYEKHNETIRGLESFLDKELWVKLMREQKDAIAGILLLQNHWRYNALPSNSEEMASVCALFCGPAKDRAYLQGAIDAVASRTALPRSLRNNRSALA